MISRIYSILALLSGSAFLFFAGLISIIVQPDTLNTALLVVSLFGAAVFSLYPIAVAHANDHATPNDYLRTSGGLLILFGIGSVLGPLVAGIVMSSIGPKGLFATTIVPHALVLAFTVWRMTKRSSVAVEDKAEFVTTVPLATTTQTVMLSPLDAGSTQ